jgi:hypothetical protein
MEAVGQGFIRPLRRKEARAKVPIRPIVARNQGRFGRSAAPGRRFQPSADGGTMVEGRHEARECSWGGGGRISAAAGQYLASIHHAVGEVTVADKPC